MNQSGDTTWGDFLDLRELKRGECVGDRYLIRRLLGEGAFGRVYQAMDQRMNRLVALKTVFNEQNADHGRRLKREIELIKSIEHGSVVRLYDAGEHDGIVFMATEYVRGRTLDVVLADDGPFDEMRTLNVIYQILDALAEALRIGVVHLDLKPENIILTEKGLRTDVVKLLDFGIAKTFEVTSQVGFAQATMGAGTPLYMAPEQIENTALGPHTDVYALGLIVIEMMSGKPAVSGRGAMDILARKQSAEIRIPSMVRPVLRRVIERSARRNYRQRYRDVVEMHNALRSVASPPWEVVLSGTAATAAIVTADVPSLDVRSADEPALVSSEHSIDDFFSDVQTGEHELEQGQPAVDPAARRTMTLSDDQRASVEAAMFEAAPKTGRPQSLPRDTATIDLAAEAEGESAQIRKRPAKKRSRQEKKGAKILRRRKD